jgi:succinate-acetate transporter protein
MPSRKFEKETGVTDLVFTLLTLGFFLLAIGYLRGCERLK